MPADLHIHTTASDGTLSPREVVDCAHRANLKIIAITDHDTVAGIDEAIKAAREVDLEVIPGVELSSQINQNEAHFLGYYINHQDPDLNKHLRRFKDARQKRGLLITEKLNSIGVKIDYEEVLRLSQGGSVGRPHVARALLESGKVFSIKEAFDKYIGYGGPAHVEKIRLAPGQAIKIIKEAGGIPVFAHPYYVRADSLIPELIKDGLAGIEVYHPDHDAKTTKYYKKLALKYNLLVTGGSDFHGSVREGVTIGKITISDEMVTRLREVLGEEK